jgi:hypothetical protein
MSNLKDFPYSNSFYTLEEFFKGWLYYIDVDIIDYTVILWYDFTHMYIFILMEWYLWLLLFCHLLGLIARILLCSYYYNNLITVSVRWSNVHVDAYFIMHISYVYAYMYILLFLFVTIFTSYEIVFLYRLMENE